MAKSRQSERERGQETGRHAQQDQFASELDVEGVPITRPVPEWLDSVDPLTEPLNSWTSRWLLAVLRFSRADGSAVFGPVGRASERLRRLQGLTDRLGDPSLSSVVSRWGPARSRGISILSPAPSPFDSRLDRSLAILRTDWDPRGDLVAIDHRVPGDTTLLEVGSRGVTWLGAAWTLGEHQATATRAKPTYTSSGTFGSCVEWSYKRGPQRVTRLAALFLGRSMALLGQQVDGPDRANEVRLSLADGIEASFAEGSRAVLLSSGRGKPTARLMPLGLPAHNRPSELGSIEIKGREVVIRQVVEGQRSWLPVLICWGKPPTTWRPLTVACRSKETRDDRAVAVRVAWGSLDEGLVVYRSLGPAALRCFLGYQTGSRFLVGSFTRSGDVRPILKVDS